MDLFKSGADLYIPLPTQPSWEYIRVNEKWYLILRNQQYFSIPKKIRKSVFNNMGATISPLPQDKLIQLMTAKLSGNINQMG